MKKEKDIYLTDKEYFMLLLKMRGVLNRKDFKADAYDSTVVGCKYTESNIGFCNEDFTTKETALFPHLWPERKSMKYRRSHHHCPFDLREPSGEFRNGCFYTCYLFKKGKVRKKISLKYLKERVEHIIKYAQENFGDKIKKENSDENS